jgi:putative transposase
VLVALGVRENGEKVLLSLITTGAESADGWQLLLDDLAVRRMGRHRLVISDGNAGLAAALDRRWRGLPQQRCTVHKLRNLLAKAPKHAHEAVREEYYGMVYAEISEVARKARESFLLKWKKQCPGVAASLEEAGENLLTLYRFPESQWRSLRTTNAIERMQLEFRRRVKTQAALPNEGAVLRVFFGLWISGQMKLHHINGYRNIGGKEKAAA